MGIRTRPIVKHADQMVTLHCRICFKGEVKVLVSGDGGNFEEAACWKQSQRQDVAYSETIFFQKPTNVKALTILMRSPMPWGYFGITSTELLVKTFPFMLVSGSIGVAEECVVARPSGLEMQSCLEAIAAADGREIWSLSAAGQLTSNGGQCVTLMGGNVAGGGRVGFESCAHGSENGASIWAVGSDGQLRMRTGGDFCLSVSKVGGRVRSCADSTASDQYLQVAVEEFDPNAGAAANNAATLLKAAVRRQQRLLVELQTVAGKCSAGHLLANVSRPVALVALSAAKLRTEDADGVIASMFQNEMLPARQTIEISSWAVRALRAQGA